MTGAFGPHHRPGSGGKRFTADGTSYLYDPESGEWW